LHLSWHLFLTKGAIGAKGTLPTAPCACKALPKCASARGSAKETISSLAVDDDDESGKSEMDIEITGECPAEDKVLCGSLSMAPRTVNPIVSGSATKEKGKPKDLQVELQEVLAESTYLKQENACLKNSILTMCQHAHAHQVDLLILSNKLFVMSQEWADVESHLSESL
jgi:hypothetical protein